jgi:glycerophosphoryl diester phosphodiesterase
MIQELLKLEQKYNMDGNVVYSSFNHYFLQQMKKVLPHTSIAILYMCGLVDAWEYAKKLDAEAIHPYFPNLKHETLVEECHQRGIAVRPWTVDEEEEIQYLFKIGVDAIITNKPDVVKRLK